jgi:hypothetical protein
MLKKSTKETTEGLSAIAENNGAKIHFDPSRYGAELHPAVTIFEIPS